MVGGGATAQVLSARRVRAGATSSYENPWTIPNLLSMMRIGLATVLGYLILEEDFNAALTRCFCFSRANGFVGWIYCSKPGQSKNQLWEVLLIHLLIKFFILYISLTYADLISVPLTYMIISRDVLLIAVVFYVRYRTLPTPRTLAKYFNPCYTTAKLKPTFISKVNTAVQLILVAASLAAAVFNYADRIYLQILWCCTAFLQLHQHTVCITMAGKLFR